MRTEQIMAGELQPVKMCAKTLASLYSTSPNGIQYGSNQLFLSRSGVR